MGRIFRPVYYVRDKATGKRVLRESKYLHIEWTDAAGRTRHKKAGLKELDARTLLLKMETDAINERNGLPTITASNLTCKDLMDRYLCAQKPHITPRHHYLLTQRLRDVIQGIRAHVVRQITPDTVEAFLGKLQDEGLSARSANCYLQSVKGMLRWTVKRRLLPYSPLDCVSPRPETERRRVRRALSEEEVGRLLNAALTGPIRRACRVYQNRPRKDGSYKPVSMPLEKQARLADEGRHMALTYRLFIETGLRRNEAALLTWADLDLVEGTLTTRPEWTGNKSGRREMIPLTPGLCDALKKWQKNHPASDTARVVKVTSRVLRIFDDDLVAAGIAKRVPVDRKGIPIPMDQDGKPMGKPVDWKIDKRDGAGRVIDIHALRHTCGSRLVAAGVDIRTVQTIMRHASAELTLGVYCHTDRRRMIEAAKALPELRPYSEIEQPNPAPAKTGTDDKEVAGERDSSSGRSPSDQEIDVSTRGQQRIGKSVHNKAIDNVLCKFQEILPKPKVAGPSPVARSNADS